MVVWNVLNSIIFSEWSSIAGLGYAKKVIMEAVILPILRPDIFTGMRQPPRGVLLVSSQSSNTHDKFLIYRKRKI